MHAVSFDAALASSAPQRFASRAGAAPLHPSFEDRIGVPDRVFAMLDDDEYDLQVAAWARELEAAGARDADVLHLHHLTPLNEAAARIAPHVPIVGQLHGTELLMLERIAGAPTPDWRYAERWAERIRGWARNCARIVVAPAAVDRAVSVLGVPSARVVAVPNGVDVDLFTPRAVDREAFWRRVLVEQPRGSLPGGQPGSLRYREGDVSTLAAGTVLLYIGRFTAVKRLDHLIGAFGRAQDRLQAPVGLVLVGGHPGEWEGEHPAEIASRLGVPQVFLAGWYAHEDLPDFLSAADVTVLTSEREQFGQALVEGMACGLPAVATRSLGPEAIIDDGETGWLVNAGDETALTSALTDAAQHEDERQRRGRLARIAARERYSWAAASEQLTALLEEVAGERRPHASLALPQRQASSDAIAGRGIVPGGPARRALELRFLRRPRFSGRPTRPSAARPRVLRRRRRMPWWDATRYRLMPPCPERKTMLTSLVRSETLPLASPSSMR